MFPPEPPVAITARPERRAGVKGAPFLGAAKRTLDCEHRCGTRYTGDGRRSGNMIPLVGSSRLRKNACEVISELFHRVWRLRTYMSKRPTDSWVSQSVAIPKVLAAFFACSAQEDTLLLMLSPLHSPLPGSGCGPCCKWRRPA